MSGFYQNTDAEKFLYYHTLSYDLYEEVYRLAPTQHNARKLLHSKVGQAIALRWFTVGSGLTPSDKGYDNIYKSVDLLLEVIPTIETLSKEDFKRYCHISVVAQSTLAENYFFLQEYDACETYFIKALQVMEKANERNIEIYNEVNHGQLFNNLGYLYYICKDYEKGEQAFLKSIEVLSPYVKSNYSLYALNIYFRALINVAVLYNDTAKYDRALKYGYEGLEHSETLYNYSAEMFYAEYVLILKTLALAENSLGNADKAIELIDKAIVAEPANAELKEIKAKFIGE
jgi:tetratricopeptide (TPR) repeat protein